MATLFLVVIYAAFISLGLPDSLLGVAWPVLQPELGVPLSYAGILSMFVSGCTIVSSLLSMRMLRRFGIGKVTLVSVLATAFALLGYTLSAHFAWLILWSIPLGLGAGAIDAGLNAYVAAHYKAHHMSWLHCFWGVGAMLGPALMSQFILQGHSWRLGAATITGVQFAMAVVLLFSLPLWDKVAALARTQAGAVAEDAAPAEPPKDEAKPFLYPLRLPGAKLVLAAFFFYSAIEASMGLWGSSFLVNTRGMEPAIAARWVSGFFASITVGRFLSGFGTLYLSNKAMIRLGMWVATAGTLLLLPLFPPVLSSMGFLLVGLGCSPIFPCMLHETPSRFGKEDSLLLMGFQMAVSYTSGTFVPPLLGLGAARFGFGIFPFLLVAFGLLMALSFEGIGKRSDVFSRKTK